MEDTKKQQAPQMRTQPAFQAGRRNTAKKLNTHQQCYSNEQSMVQILSHKACWPPPLNLTRLQILKWKTLCNLP